MSFSADKLVDIRETVPSNRIVDTYIEVTKVPSRPFVRRVKPSPSVPSYPSSCLDMLCREPYG